MKNSIKNRLAMYKAVQTVIAENNSAWAGFPAFETAVQQFTDKVDLLEQAGYNQRFAIAGVSALRDSKRKSASERFEAIAASISAYAVVSNRPQLIEQMKINKTDLFYCSSIHMLQQIDLVIAKATEHLGELTPYGIDQGILDELIATREELNILLTSPRKAITDRKLITSQLNILSKDINDLLRFRLDNLMKMIKFEHPDFFEAYHNARVIVDLRSRGRNTDDSSNTFDHGEE